ncbi:MAG: hypothetical protein ACXVPM_19725 [Bacteroidia bacterium]
MKTIVATVFLSTAFATYSQTDTIPTTKKSADKKCGFSVFGGLGLGGNDISNTNWSSGYAKTISARFHKGIHTINTYASQVTSPDQPIFNKVSSATTLNMHNFGLTYGIGTYGKHYSVGCLIGLAYTNLTTISQNVTLYDPRIAPTYSFNKYHVVNACFGLHSSLKTKYIGIGYQVYYNLFGGLSSFNALIGIELTLK